MRTAIVEIEDSHAECLYSQLEFLKQSNHHVTLVCTKSIQNVTNRFNNVDTVKIFDFNGNKIKNTLNLFKLFLYLNNNFDFVIFNTCSGNKIRNLCILPLRKPNLTGIIHNLKKIHESNNQKIISKRIKKYFVLNDELLKNRPKNELKISSFYPIFFPNNKTVSLHKPKNEIWITIPGQIEQSRRNYQFLIDQLNQGKIKKEIKFILLGRVSKKDMKNKVYSRLIENIIKHKNRIVFFNEFIDEDLFHNYIEKSDFIMPLLNSNNNEAYKKYKISGTNNLAFAYKKMLLVHSNFKNYEDFIENGIFYDDINFTETINNLKNINKKNAYQNKKWNFEFQKNKYINFVKK